MNFIIDYEICAILFLIVTLFAFFSKRFLPTRQNKYYGWLLISGLFFLCLDAFTCIADRYCYAFAPWFLYAINILLLMTAQSYLVLVYAYAVVLIRRDRLFAKKARLLLIVPILIVYVLLLSSPWTHWIFYLGENNSYWHGPLHFVLYISSTAYLVCTMIAVLLARKTVERKVRLTMAAFLVLSVAATFLQFLFPRYMLNGVAIALSLNIMLHVLQSPDLYIEKMTGLYNRNAIPQLVECQEQRREPFSIVVYQIDGMGNITNLFGMYGGEEVLGVIAKEIQKAYPRHEIFRNGNDGIGVIVPHARITDDNVDKYAAKFPTTIEYQNQELPVFCRTLAMSGEDFSSEDSVMFAIDQGMETLRNEGFAGSVFVCDRETDASFRYRRKAETELRERIARKDIEVRFFPVNAMDGQLYAAEAQMSMQDDRGETLDMATMYALAAARGQVIPLNALLLERVCMFLKRYDIRRWGARHVLVPLSPQACMETPLAVSVQRILTRYQTDPQLICFTVTETCAVSSANNLEPNMRQLVKAGCSFMLDKYGTGYANLDLLSRLPFQYLNMEADFVEIAWRHREGKAFVSNIIRLFEGMNIAVSCTEKDTDTHMDELEEMGFRYIHTYGGPLGLTEEQFRDCLADSASAIWGR